MVGAAAAPCTTSRQPPACTSAPHLTLAEVCGMETAGIAREAALLPGNLLNPFHLVGVRAKAVAPSPPARAIDLTLPERRPTTSSRRVCAPERGEVGPPSSSESLEELLLLWSPNASNITGIGCCSLPGPVLLLPDCASSMAHSGVSSSSSCSVSNAPYLHQAT